MPDRTKWADQHFFTPFEDVRKAIGELPIAFIICDLDGTLCDDSHRAHYARARDWQGYHARLGEDTCYSAVMLVVRLMLERGLHILFLTSRPKQFEAETVAWLNAFFCWWPSRTHLLMRPDGDTNPSAALKLRLYEEWKATHPSWGPLFALEDKDTVTAMWRGLGIPCFQTREDYYRHGE